MQTPRPKPSTSAALRPWQPAPSSSNQEPAQHRDTAAEPSALCCKLAKANQWYCPAPPLPVRTAATERQPAQEHVMNDSDTRLFCPEACREGNTPVFDIDVSGLKVNASDYTFLCHVPPKLVDPTSPSLSQRRCKNDRRSADNFLVSHSRCKDSARAGTL